MHARTPPGLAARWQHRLKRLDAPTSRACLLAGPACPQPRAEQPTLSLPCKRAVPPARRMQEVWARFAPLRSCRAPPPPSLCMPRLCLHSPHAPQQFCVAPLAKNRFKRRRSRLSSLPPSIQCTLARTPPGQVCAAQAGFPLSEWCGGPHYPNLRPFTRPYGISIQV